MSNHLDRPDRANNAVQEHDSATNLVVKTTALGVALVGATVVAAKVISGVRPWWGTPAVTVVLLPLAAASVGGLVAWVRHSLARRRKLWRERDADARTGV